MTLLAVFLFLLAYYYVVLRRFNTLGFRLFSLCVFVSIAFLYWWWGDYRALKNLEENGISSDGLVWEKKQQGGDWLITVVVQGPNFDLDMRPLDKAISTEELKTIVLKEPVKVRFVPLGKGAMLEQSYQRHLRDNNWFLLFPAFFLLLGCAAWFFLRRYRIHPHEGTVYEYMTDESGNVVLDDAKNEDTKNLKKWSMISKFIDLLGKK